MIDMNKEVSGLLQSICTVQLAFPEIDSDFPYVSLTEIGNSCAAVLFGEERYSRYECQIRRRMETARHAAHSLRGRSAQQ